MELRYTLYERDPDKPWLITNVSHRSIELANADDLADWARQHWPAVRYTVELEPGQTSRLMA